MFFPLRQTSINYYNQTYSNEKKFLAKKAAIHLVIALLTFFHSRLYISLIRS